MKYLLLNQAFYPDTVSTSQHLQDLAAALVQAGHEVTVLSSRRGYDNPGQKFPPMEQWRGVRIRRVGSTGFGKSHKWGRVIDFSTFLINCSRMLILLPRHDVVVALTSPPLIAFLAAGFVCIRGGSLVYWVMDLNPDEAIAAGWIKEGSLLAKCLEAISRFCLRQATQVIVLDRFMSDRIANKGIQTEKIRVLPPWSHDDSVTFDEAGRLRFRREHGLEGKFVVMYAGNHSPCHPLDTLLAAAQENRDDSGIVFCFMGGGAEFKKAQRLENGCTIRCFPYQPLNELAACLSAADLHIVIMGDAFVGIVHPCKIYNVLAVGAPVLCIGPRTCHLSEIVDSLGSDYPARIITPGSVEELKDAILCFRSLYRDWSRIAPRGVCQHFSHQTLIPQILGILGAQ